MTETRNGLTVTLSMLILATLAFGTSTVRAQEATPPLTVVATVPDLGDIARTVGGDAVDVTVLTKGPQDPHTLEARPSFVRELHDADLFLFVGLELEIGWAPALLRTARNPRVLRGGGGYLDASKAIRPLQLPTTPVDRSMGDVHTLGNPHYLLDPLNGLRVAAHVRDRLTRLRPEEKSAFTRRFDAFRERLAARLLGKRLVEKYGGADLPKLFELLDRGGLERFLAFLDAQKQRGLLGGWLGALAPHRGALLAADHDIWPYVAARFGLRVVAFLEPKPGLAPTTRHLGKVVRTMRGDGVKVVLTSPYFDLRHAQFVAKHAGARIASMAHQSGARDGARGYLEMIDWNVRRLSEALGK